MSVFTCGSHTVLVHPTRLLSLSLSQKIIGKVKKKRVQKSMNMEHAEEYLTTFAKAHPIINLIIEDRHKLREILQTFVTVDQV